MLEWVLIQYDCVYRKEKLGHKLTERKRGGEGERKHHMKIKAEIR